MRKGRLLLVLSALVLLGCASQQYWTKRVSFSQDDFNKDNFECLQQSQRPVSSSYSDQYGGSSSSTVETNYELYNACMYAKGWYLTNER